MICRLKPVALFAGMAVLAAQFAIAEPLETQPPRYRIVSDIDDTIKATHMTRKLPMVYNGLFGKTAYAGMAKLYEALERRETQIIYLSGGLRSLRGRLESFLKKQNFPKGTLLLRAIQSERNQHGYKLARLETLAQQENTPFILIGDDTQFDPEVYTEFQARHPELVAAVYIRQVTGRKIPDQVHPFTTAFEIALQEVREGRLSSEDAESVGLALLNPEPHTVVIPSYALCQPPQSTPAEEIPLDEVLESIREQLNLNLALRCAR